MIDTPVVSSSEPRRSPSPNTFSSIKLEVEQLAVMSFDKFVTALVADLAEVKSQRAAFYEQLRRSNARWANGARALLAVLGATALLLTALAAAVRLAPDMVPFINKESGDRAVLVGILVIYAVMGAITFYEKGSDKTSAYFRQIATLLVIRDLWTKLQFELAKELIPLKGVVDPATTDPVRLRILALGQAFCVDLDKAATGELAEFRTEFMTSLAELGDAAKKGQEEIVKQLEDRFKLTEKAAAEATAAAEKAANDAKTAAKALQDAAKPGFINLAVTGDFDGQVTILVGGIESVRSPGKQIALERLPPGPTTISARAQKGAKDLETSVTVDVKPGLQDVKLTLS